MEIQKFILDDFETDEISVGLVRLAKKIPDYEFFFRINEVNNFNFSRIEDLVIQGKYFNYSFPVFEGYSKDEKACFRFIGNKSSESTQKEEITELFTDEQNVKLLINDHPDIDYIINSSDKIADFSLILLPENTAFAIQEISIQPDNELYQTIQYYE